MLALSHYRQNIHDQCGGYLPDTTAPEAEDRYKAGLPIRCHQCTERLRAYERHRENSAPHIDALLFPVERR